MAVMTVYQMVVLLAVMMVVTMVENLDNYWVESMAVVKVGQLVGN